jgi:hypothetical protein
LSGMIRFSFFRRGARCLLVFLVLAGVSRAQDAGAEGSTFRASASLEGGVESTQRRYFRPQLKFEFPIRFGRVFADLDYYHRTNGDLEGEVDFWLGLGLKGPLSSHSEIEVFLQHFCRHLTSRDYPVVLDINELLARFWYMTGGLKLGLGGGTYLGTSNHYDGLLVLDLAWPRIFRSELSASAEVKWVDFNQLLYDFELAVGLNPSVDLVARLTRHYAYPTTTYFGLRFKSQDAAEPNVDQFRLRGGFLPDDEDRKVFAAVEFNLHFFRTPDRQLLLTLSGDIPIERGDAFLGTFRPEEIKYLADVVYERRLGPELSAFGYGRYDLHMPVDVAQRFDSSWGLGLGLRNQTYFKKLDRNFRYVVFAGRNYGHSYDVGVAVGVNTTGKPVNIGGDVQLSFKPGEFHALYELFIEAGSTPKVRPFLAFERTEAQTEGRSISRFQLGLDLFAWH